MILPANGPTSWGVDYAADAANPPWQDVLDGISAAGYRWLELGPVGYLPQTPAELESALARRDLQAVGTFLYERLDDPSLTEHVLAVARSTCELIRAAHGRHLVVVCHVVPERAAVAGNSAAARRLDNKEWIALIDTIRSIAEIARGFELRAVLHPHVGTFIEFEDEIDAALDLLGHDLIGLCLDSGHIFYAGSDPAELVRKFRKRLEHVHLKDVRADVRDRYLPFQDAVAAGVFTPLGEGSVDLPHFCQALIDVDYSGAATVEQDRNPGLPADPVADARTSLRYLKDHGIDSPARGDRYDDVNQSAS